MAKLTDGPSDRQPIDLRAWCEERNAEPLFVRMERWYFVRQTDNGEQVDTLEGCDATNLRKLLDGTLQDFIGWLPARTDGYRNWLHSVAERGRAIHETV